MEPSPPPPLPPMRNGAPHARPSPDTPRLTSSSPAPATPQPVSWRWCAAATRKTTAPANSSVSSRAAAAVPSARKAVAGPGPGRAASQTSRAVRHRTSSETASVRAKAVSAATNGRVCTLGARDGGLRGEPENQRGGRGGERDAYGRVGAALGGRPLPEQHVERDRQDRHPQQGDRPRHERDGGVVDVPRAQPAGVGAGAGVVGEPLAEGHHLETAGELHGAADPLEQEREGDPGTRGQAHSAAAGAHARPEPDHQGDGEHRERGQRAGQDGPLPAAGGHAAREDGRG